MVALHLVLEPVLGDLLLDGGATGVVDEDVQSGLAPQDARGELPHGSQRSQVELPDQNVLVPGQLDNLICVPTVQV